MMTRGATLFSGGGGVEALLKQRIDFVHAVEYDPAIAGVYRQNHGDHIQVAKVEDVDYSLWGELDYLHASPVCKNASQAKTGGVESDGDIQAALAVVRCLEATQPRVFSLENVWGYRNFQAFRRICQALDRGGYMWHFEHLNAADFGVPQTRKRLILRAVRDSLLPGWPEPEKWVGWYAAIEDLLPGLPDSKFADWQLARLPETLIGAGLHQQSRTDDGSQHPRRFDEPMFTVAASSHNSHFPDTKPKAFLVASNSGPNSFGDNTRHVNDPAFTANPNANGRMRAWLVYGENTSAHPGSLPMKDEAAPALTVRADAIGHGSMPRAWLSQGRVVKMTPRALARFQSLPDSYVLPDKSSLACAIIGNMVPSLMMQKIVEPLL